MTWRKVLVAPKREWQALKLGLAPNESRKTADSSDVRLWGWHPIGFGATELWKLTRFGKHENSVQFRSPYLPLRLCYCDRTCTKAKPFPCTLKSRSHCLWPPYRFGAMQYQSQLRLKKIKLWVKLNHLYLLNEKHHSNETSTKWCSFHVLSDDIYFVGNIPYRFGPMWQSYLYNIKILVNFIHKCDGTNINNAHSVYFLVMFTLLVTLHVNLELGLEHTVVVQY